jgi:uncharacterized protein YbaR (Trm112 family)
MQSKVLNTILKQEAISAELLALLCCPETRHPLAVAPEELVARLEALRVAGTLQNRGGKPVTEPVREGFLRADGTVFYPVSGGIPLLVLEEGVMVPQT